MENQKSFKEILKYIGDPTQLFGIKDYTLNGGKRNGVRSIDVKNGAGLDFTVLPDRGLDISNLFYKGLNLSYISKTGVVSPVYYDPRGTEFLRSFFAGFLTTCGLQNAGRACVDNGEEFGLHGRISNTPAEEVCAYTEFDTVIPAIKVSGKIRQAKVFGENLILKREISTAFGENKICINDVVYNQGFRTEPLMILYHFNFGYPFLSENAYIFSPAREVVPRDEEAQKDLVLYNKIQTPSDEYCEQVFFHKIASLENGRTFGSIVNEELQLGIAIWFNINQLSRLTQWKQMQAGEYTIGIEPSNCSVGGRTAAKAEGSLEYIEPGENRRFDIEIEFLEGYEAVNNLELLCRKILEQNDV